MLVTETAWGKRIKTDVLILGTGASGVGAALRAAELKADVLMVGQGRLESSGCLGGGNDHFMAALGTDEPNDTREAFVGFFMKSAFGYREAQLNLSGAFGTIAFGRMGQLASANGSFGLLGQTSPFSSGWGDSIGQKFVTADGWTRFDNTITYATPDFAGFKVYAQYSLKNSSTEGGDEGKSSANRYYGIAATYKAENLYLVGIVDSINHGKQMYFGGTGYNYTYDADQLTVTLGGNYDFGVAKVYAMGQYFQNAIAVGQKYITDSSFGKFGYSFGDTAGWEGADGYGLALGVGVPVLGGTAKAHVGYMDAEAAEDSSRKLSRWNVAVGYDYSLSKRTSVYSAAAYTKDDNTDYSGLEPSSVEVIAGLIHRF